MSAFTKNLPVPFIFALLAGIPGAVAVHSLRIGAIWRGGGREPMITLANDAAGFYGAICFLLLLTLIFGAGAIWSAVVLIRHRRE
jgi:hypothetical protein